MDFCPYPTHDLKQIQKSRDRSKEFPLFDPGTSMVWNWLCSALGVMRCRVETWASPGTIPNIWHFNCKHASWREHSTHQGCAACQVQLARLRQHHAVSLAALVSSAKPASDRGLKKHAQLARSLLARPLQSPTEASWASPLRSTAPLARLSPARPVEG